MSITIEQDGCPNNWGNTNYFKNKVPKYRSWSEKCRAGDRRGLNISRYMIAVLVLITGVIPAAAPAPASAATKWKVGQAAWTNEAAACVSIELLRDAVKAKASNDLVWFRNHTGQCVILKQNLRAEVFEVVKGAVGVKVREHGSAPWIRLYTTNDGIWPCSPGFCN